MKRVAGLWLATLAAACGADPDARDPRVGGPAALEPAYPGGRVLDPGSSGPIETTPTPVPLSGGTLLVTRDDRFAWASSPDADVVWKVDLDAREVVETFRLSLGDEPGRLVEDGAGRIHVVLRRGGAVVRFDPAPDGVRMERRPVCAEPRGIAWDRYLDALHVACASGDLVTLPAAGGAPTRRLDLGPDLRDVIVSSDGVLAVTRFRHATLERLDAEGRVTETSRSGLYDPFALEPGFEAQFVFEPSVAWRAVAVPGGGGTVAMVHQRARITNVDTQLGGYAGTGCDGGLVHAALTLFRPGETAPAAPLPVIGATLPVDVAVSTDGQFFAVAAAGAGAVYTWRSDVTAIVDPGPCAEGAPVTWLPNHGGIPVAVAFRDGGVVTQFRAPAHLELTGEPPIELPGETSEHTGYDLFHFTSPALACASCHPEGREDGQVWILGGAPRRTQTTAGGILATAPFHWSGDMASLDDLSVAVFHRMAMPVPPKSQLGSLARWVDAIPAVDPRVPADAAALRRGEKVFEQAGCGGCHAGPLFSDGAAADVGTGGAFQVPSLLGVSQRAPFLHDGRAATLEDTLAHGDTEGLTPADAEALLSFLRSL